MRGGAAPRAVPPSPLAVDAGDDRLHRISRTSDHGRRVCASHAAGGSSSCGSRGGCSVRWCGQQLPGSAGRRVGAPDGRSPHRRPAGQPSPEGRERRRGGALRSLARSSQSASLQPSITEMPPFPLLPLSMASLRPLPPSSPCPVLSCVGCGSEIAHCRLELQWTERPSLARLQEVVRELRYDALLSACHECGASHLLLGHHLQDQQETFLYRFTRASGIVGLAAMAPSQLLSSSSHPSLHLCRPLLSISKPRLLSTCHGRFSLLHCIDDPSNANLAFDRVRIRQSLCAIEQLSEQGRTFLAQLQAAHTAATSAAHDFQLHLQQLQQRWVMVDELGVATLSAGVWLQTGDELIAALLSRLFTLVRGGSYRVNLRPVVDLVRRVRQGGHLALLCSGCVLRPALGEHGDLLVMRAMTADVVEVEDGGGKVVWDERFELRLTPPKGWTAKKGWQLRVRALRPDRDLVGRFALDDGPQEQRQRLNSNLPALVRWKQGPTSHGKRGVVEELLCVPHQPGLPRSEPGHPPSEAQRWGGWGVEITRLCVQATPSIAGDGMEAA